jgi:hypothetical protein
MSLPQPLNLPDLKRILPPPRLAQSTAMRLLGIGCGTLLYALPTLAHQVQVTDTVGATLHIEPNDLPRAGSPHQVWFALTQAGGQTIPLSDCDCTLTLYGGDGTAIATPILSPVSAEGYQSIPAADVTFPAVGTYELTLVGAPQGDATFEPFELSFDVTVAAGTAASADPDPEKAASPPSAAPEVAADRADGPQEDREPNGEAPASSEPAVPSPWPRFALMGVGLVALVGAAIWRSLRGNS